MGPHPVYRASMFPCPLPPPQCAFQTPTPLCPPQHGTRHRELLGFAPRDPRVMQAEAAGALTAPPLPCRSRRLRGGVQVRHAGAQLRLSRHLHAHHAAGAHLPRPVSAAHVGWGDRAPTAQAAPCLHPRGSCLGKIPPESQPGVFFFQPEIRGGRYWGHCLRRQPRGAQPGCSCADCLAGGQE